MYISDKRTSDFLAMIAVLVVPWYAAARDAWGWIMEVLLLLAVVWLGRTRGPLRIGLAMLFGYGIALFTFGMKEFAQGLVPWAGLLTIWAEKKGWPQREVLFWSLALAGILGAIPTLSFAYQGLAPETVKAMVNSTVQQYQATGMLAALEQQGMSEVQLRYLIEKAVYFYHTLVPGLAAIAGFIELGAVYYFFGRWFPEEGKKIVPFSHWRFPWYAIWGAILGLASYLLGDYFHWSSLRGLGINLMAIYSLVALVLGSAVYSFFLRSPNLPGFLKWILIIGSIIYLQITVVSLVLFGLFDMVLNFRRLPETSV